MILKLVKNNIIDDLFGIIGGPEIPTKQDKFKPIFGEKAIIHKNDGTTEEITGDVYIMNNKASESTKKFEAHLKTHLKAQITEEHPYPKEIKLEVIVSISMTSKRFAVVDIDNLLKYIFDCMNGLVYEDDSQIISVLASKKIIKDVSIPQLNGIQIGIRKLNNKNSLLSEMSLYDFEAVEPENKETEEK